MGVATRSVQVTRVAALILSWYRNACAALDIECIACFLEIVNVLTYDCYILTYPTYQPTYL
jgi:hypothetical protein